MDDQIHNEHAPNDEQHHGDVTTEGPSMAPMLQILRGDSAGKTHKLKFKSRVGRETDNDIVIVDPRISRYHFQISYEDGKWLLSDLGSVNGTQVNNMMVDVPLPLKQGDKISLGETVLVFRDPTVEKDQPFHGADTQHGRSSDDYYDDEPEPNSTRMAWIAGALLLLLVLAVAGFFFFSNRNSNGALNAPTNAPDAATTVEVPRSTPRPEQNLVLKLEDDFSDSFGGWDDAFGKNFTKQYGNNRYHIELTTNNLVVWGLANRIVADFEVEVEAREEDGGDGSTYGLIFRYTDPDNYYRFDIAGDGFFLLTKRIEGNWETLVDWTESDAILKGLEQINVLKVSAAGSDISIYANGTQLAKVQDMSFSEGNFGFFASTFDDPIMWVSFDNLKLWAPPDQEVIAIPTAGINVPTPTVVVAVATTPTPTPNVGSTPTASEAVEANEPTPTAEVEETAIETDLITETLALTETQNLITETLALSETADLITETLTITETLDSITQTVALSDTPSSDVASNSQSQTLPEFVSRDQPAGRGETERAGKIYFSLYDSVRRTYDIYRANASGAEIELIQTEASQVTISNSGTHIGFRSWKSDERGLYSRPLDAQEKWRFVQFFEAASPVFSNDDGFFVFHSRQGGGPAAIYRTFGNEHEVMRREGIPIQGEMISLTPDGRFVSRGCTQNTCGLIISNLDGGAPLQLTDHADDTAPSVSPDGETIAFMTNRDGNWEIYSIDVDGQNLTKLTDDSGNDGIPTWSPDGNYIAFATDRDGAWAIWEMLPDGRLQRQLFELSGSVDGVVEVDVAHSFGWLEERLVWTEE